MAKLKCPKCKSPNVQKIAGKTKNSLNLNPLHPLTFTNLKPVGKQTWQCMSCGKIWKQKV